MDREPTGTGRLPPLGGRRTPIFSSIGVDLPIAQKPTSPRRDGGRLRRAAISVRNGVQGRQRWDLPAIRSAASGRSRGSTVAWCPALRRQTRRLEEALSRYGTPEIFSTDQGSQFTSD